MRRHRTLVFGGALIALCLVALASTGCHHWTVAVRYDAPRRHHHHRHHAPVYRPAPPPPVYCPPPPPVYCPPPPPPRHRHGGPWR